MYSEINYIDIFNEDIQIFASLDKGEYRLLVIAYSKMFSLDDGSSAVHCIQELSYYLTTALSLVNAFYDLLRVLLLLPNSRAALLIEALS